MNLKSKLLVEECKPELSPPCCGADSMATGPSTDPSQRLGKSKMSEGGVLALRLLRTSSSHSCLFKNNEEAGREKSCVTLDAFDPKLIMEGSADELEATIKLDIICELVHECWPM